ncbi:hypothetical protein [Candidatus Nitrospira bockiana]
MSPSQKAWGWNWRAPLLWAAGLALICAQGTLLRDAAGGSPSAGARITIDATALTPPGWWYVPGVTPIIWSLDPDSTEAFRTTESRTLVLTPGAYRFGTFTFDFPFVVTEQGTLDFASSLDHCVRGRGDTTLTVRCGRTQPYSGRPDY